MRRSLQIRSTVISYVSLTGNSTKRPLDSLEYLSIVYQKISKKIDVENEMISKLFDKSHVLRIGISFSITIKISMKKKIK